MILGYIETACGSGGTSTYSSPILLSPAGGISFTMLTTPLRSRRYPAAPQHPVFVLMVATAVIVIVAHTDTPVVSSRRCLEHRQVRLMAIPFFIFGAAVMGEGAVPAARRLGVVDGRSGCAAGWR
jgi:hypothetical protein